MKDETDPQRIVAAKERAELMRAIGNSGGTAIWNEVARQGRCTAAHGPGKSQQDT